MLMFNAKHTIIIPPDFVHLPPLMKGCLAEELAFEDDCMELEEGAEQFSLLFLSHVFCPIEKMQIRKHSQAGLSSITSHLCFIYNWYYKLGCTDTPFLLKYPFLIHIIIDTSNICTQFFFFKKKYQTQSWYCLHTVVTQPPW